MVTKKDSRFYICADFKMTVNCHLYIQTYPLSTPDEVFSTLANDESFTKLDFAGAYQQLKVVGDGQNTL